MKKFLIAFALIAGALTASAKDAAKNDTVKVDNTKIEKVIEDQTTNSKGQAVVKYYLLYNKELIPTSKNVVEMYKLCKEYGADLALAMVINTKTNRKRIIRD